MQKQKAISERTIEPLHASRGAHIMPRRGAVCAATRKGL
jgi:hypothetical protein